MLPDLKRLRDMIDSIEFLMRSGKPKDTILYNLRKLHVDLERVTSNEQ